jgi:hypothetical protein
VEKIEMITTMQIFETRKTEIELSYSVLLDLKLEEQPNGKTITIDKAHTERFAPILKSNILLMLYNLVEACVRMGFVEIYDSIKDSGLAYKDLIESIRNIWSNFEIRQTIKPANATPTTYENKVQSIISKVISGGTIILTEDALSISGNLDARAIRQLLDDHSINITDRTDKHHVLLVKNKRNALGHGIDSFGESARDISIIQLAEIKDEVLNFIFSVIGCMKLYYDGREYQIRN